MATTTKDFAQVIKSVFEESTESLRVSGVSVSFPGGMEIVIDHTEGDSVQIGDGTNTVTVTQSGADYGLDVNVINTQLDIDDLAAGTDSVDAYLKDGSGTSITSANYLDRTPLDVHVTNLNEGAFDEQTVATLRPLVQIDAILGIRNTDVETFTSTGGSVTIKNDHNGQEFQCATGTSLGGYGLIRSRRVGRYRPGQGIKCRFTARFDAGVASCRTAAGLIGVGNELSFGYNGTNFGILWRRGGRLEGRTLSISSPATTTQTATITLNGTAYSVSITSGTAAHNAFEIATDSQFGIDQAWTAHQNGDSVLFVSNTVGAKTGSYSFTSTGAATGTFSQTMIGQAVTDTFYNQSSWNRNTLLSGGFILDPSQGNVFQIEYEFLGYGGLIFKIKDPNSGRFIEVHRVVYPNANTSPILDTPIFQVGWFAASLGSTTDINTYGCSGAIFLEGRRTPFRRPVARGNTKTGIGTTLTNVLAIKVRPEINGSLNLAEVIAKEISVAVDGTKPASFEVHLNPTFTGEPNWTFHDQANSLVEYNTVSNTITSNTEILGGAIDKSGSFVISIDDDFLVLNKNDVLAIAIKATSGTTDATAYITWVDD